MVKYSIPLSVVMPCYNSESYITRAIESVLNQTFKEFELIIVDDGSIDGTRKEIKRSKDKRILYIYNSKNCGNYAARNQGMSFARGKYVCVMDADDLALPNRFSVQLQYLETHKRVAAVGALSEIIDDRDRTIGFIDRPSKPSAIKVSLLKDNCLTHSTLMMRRHLIKKYGLFYNEWYKFSADYDLIVRLSNLFPVWNLRETLLKYRVHSKQISAISRFPQIEFADHVRRNQLRQFGLFPNEKEVELHLKLMKEAYIGDDELQLCENWLNKLLEANYEKSLYNKTYLYRLFEKQLAKAVRNNNLGGWSFEKVMLVYIRTHFSSCKAILEFGSGLGTDALLRYYNVVSIEHNPSFVGNRNESHVCFFAPIENGWYKRKVVQEALKCSFDLILIDGPPGELRSGVLSHIDLFRNVLSPIIFDDVQRELDRKVLNTFCENLNLQYKIIKGNEKEFAVCTKRTNIVE